MTDQDRIAALAEQIDIARKSIEKWPEWARPYAYPGGTDSLAWPTNLDRLEDSLGTLRLEA